MIQHNVLFKFPSQLSADDQATMRSLIQSWPSEMPDLRKLRLGTPVSTDHADGYQYLLLVELDDWDALNRYLRHPAHLKFGDWMTGHGATFLVFSFALDEETVVLD